MNKIKYSKEMKECPYCGEEEFYILQSFSGICEYGYRYDGKIAENGSMWENSNIKDIRKYAYCRNPKCNKRLFLIEEFYNEQ